MARLTLGARTARRLLRAERERIVALSLHAGDPGVTGAGEIGGRFDLTGALRISEDRLVTRVTLERQMVGAGTATHYGLWEADGTFHSGGALPRPVAVGVGQTVILRAGAVVLAFGEV